MRQIGMRFPPANPESGLPGSRRNLGTHALSSASPHVAADTAAATTPAEVLVHDRLLRIVKLRNRVAHMEPLLHANIPARLSDCMQILGYISPDTRDWCGGISRVTATNNARPQT